MAVYHLALHTIASIATFATLDEFDVLLTSFSLTALGCGWLAFLLFVIQIFHFESSRKGGPPC